MFFLLQYTGHEVKHASGSLPITIFDFMGLEEAAKNVHSTDLTNALRGHLPHGCKVGNRF